jgi:hypothetical protein
MIGQSSILGKHCVGWKSEPGSRSQVALRFGIGLAGGRANFVAFVEMQLSLDRVGAIT